MTERPNRDIALRYWNDLTLKAWWWMRDLLRWQCDQYPDFNTTVTWHVGHEAPTEPPARMCELAGVKFPMPMREAPAYGTKYWNPITDIETWTDHELDWKWLEMGFCQATSEGAIAQGRAMAAALLQAIEGAK